MKTITKSILLVLTCFLFMNANTWAGASKERIKASGNYITKEVKVDAFSGIHLIGSLDVIYSQSTNGKTTVEIYGSDNIVEYVDTSVRNGILTVKLKDEVDISYGKNGRLDILVSSPTLENTTLSGSGDIVLNTRLTTNDLVIKLSGSGDVIAKHDIHSKNSFIAELHGSGDIELKGKVTAPSSKLAINGSGDIVATSLNSAREGVIQLNGSGDIEVKKEYKAQELEIKLNGSGDIKVAGIQSASVEASLNGSGDMDLSGNTQTANLFVENSGSLNCKKLISQQVEATVRGSGDIKCHAEKHLKTSVTGSGEIGYKGNPTVESSTKEKNVRRL